MPAAMQPNAIALYTPAPYGLDRCDVKALFREARRNGVIHGAQLGRVALQRSDAAWRRRIVDDVSVCHNRRLPRVVALRSDLQHQILTDPSHACLELLLLGRTAATCSFKRVKDRCRG